MTQFTDPDRTLHTIRPFLSQSSASLQKSYFNLSLLSDSYLSIESWMLEFSAKISDKLMIRRCPFMHYFLSFCHAPLLKYVETESRRKSATYIREENTSRIHAKLKVTRASYKIDYNK